MAWWTVGVGEVKKVVYQIVREGKDVARWLIGQESKVSQQFAR